jgi:hypothetical protein
MGICQTVGGAATSGQGISGSQIAYAIRVGAGLQPEGRKDKLYHSFEAIPGEEFTEKVTTTVYYEPPAGTETTDNDKLPISVTSYAPKAFQYIRGLEGIGDEQFISEWDLSPDQCEMKLGEGRSMALFLKSKHLDFMCKTIAEVEVNVLMDLLPKYAQHIRDYQNSLLMRFNMLLRVEIKESVGFILCFGDIFSSCQYLNERWDLKGRVPKPGKYLHFPHHKSSLKPHAASIPTGGATENSAFTNANRDETSPSAAPSANEPTATATTADGHLAVAADEKPAHRRRSSIIAEHADIQNAEPVSPSSKSLVTRKDKELSRLFWVKEAVRRPLLAQLHADYDFLCSNGLMDYSILIGVKYNKVSESSMRRRRKLGESQAGEFEKRPTVRGSPKQHISRCDFHNGVDSIGNEETYYIGIIDMLTVYNVKKKSANFFKTFLWKPETLSTIPPPDYKERIDRFTDLIFPPLDPNDA